MRDLGLKEIYSVINVPVHKQISLYPYSVFARTVHVHQRWPHVGSEQCGTCFVTIQDSCQTVVILPCCVTHSRLLQTCTSRCLYLGQKVAL